MIEQEVVMSPQQRGCKVDPEKHWSLWGYWPLTLNDLRSLNTENAKDLYECKKFKERKHYQYCWAKASNVYVGKDEGHCTVKIMTSRTSEDKQRRFIHYHVIYWEKQTDLMSLFPKLPYWNCSIIQAYDQFSNKHFLHFTNAKVSGKAYKPLWFGLF